MSMDWVDIVIIGYGLLHHELKTHKGYFISDFHQASIQDIGKNYFPGLQMEYYAEKFADKYLRLAYCLQFLNTDYNRIPLSLHNILPNFMCRSLTEDKVASVPVIRY
jgi:hypothetical protein